MSLTGNKGEWSEFYAFLKVLIDRRLDAADENLDKSNVIYPVLTLFRTEEGIEKSYELVQDTETVRIMHGTNELAVVDCSDLRSSVARIFSEILEADSRAFEVPASVDVMRRLQVAKLNAGNAKKEDLVLKIYDIFTGQRTKIGFSIKSRLGSPATLLNPSSATNFVFEVTGLNDSDIERINALDAPRSKVRDRLAAIKESGGMIRFEKVASDAFIANLQLIDTLFPEILAEVVLCHYRGEGKTLPELVQAASLANPEVRGTRIPLSSYEFKVKSFLHNVALGMVPDSPWDGILTAHGGIIVVKEDGDVVCYHLHNADEFREYLYRNTRLDTPSTGRYGFAKLEKSDGKVYLKLNLQIRFLK